ncbi:MAG TPA: SDR family NAD(P)-dependent oxidoreductase [Candidatus Acidoferrum sp.]|nr:SDR family NAD(P)-dependent oxidoreductase [Candidatus Acidoferrum sp.]
MADNERQRVVLITGAAGGLGRALTEAFADAAWCVVAAAREWGEEPALDHVTQITLDVTNAEAVQREISGVIAAQGHVDCLINNAGVIADDACWQMSDDDWDHVMNVNLRGSFLCARAVSRAMAKQRDGHIINISSFSARSGGRGQANYAASKAGLIGLAQSLAKELGSRNVRVNTVLPGVLPTKMTSHLTPEQREEFARANTLGRINSLDEVARFIVFLAGTQNISGQVFQLDSRIAPWT